MSNGFNGIILRINLSANRVEKVEFPESFYRQYMGGGAIGAYFLLKETTGDLDPLHEGNILTIAPSITTGSAITGVSRCSAVAVSPLSGAVGEGQAGGSIGPMIKRAGYDAVVITGKAKAPVFIYVSNETVEIRDASHLSGKTVGDVYDILNEELEDKKLSIIQCGPAGENCVRFASLMVDRNNVVGRTGLGAVMGSKNLRAVAVHGSGTLPVANPEGIKTLNKLAKERIPTSGFPAILKKSGTPGVVSIQAQNGNLASYNFKSGFHSNHNALDGPSYEDEIGAGKTTCYGCIIACRKRVKATTPYVVTDKLGGPEFETLSLLGTNLDITDPVAVSKANELCNQYGLDTITMGAIAAYLFESMKHNCISLETTQGETFSFGSPESLFRLIEQVALREGVGDVLADGFTAAINHFGEETAPFAIHCKGQGLPAHMAQVKPSQALMYAACPIGGDHMSAEHDWFLSSENEDALALGIFGEGNAKSTNSAKVRMTVYSQFFYSLLDTLTLCMFTWGPGNVFTYRELEDLITYTTGWKSTLWELMKVGERKINMMRQLNTRRGFTRKDDILPDRVYDPIPEGPSRGAHVDRDRFPAMLGEYYELMGWHAETGTPSTGKLIELGLEWAL